MIGETISHYRIIQKIGAGGMGEVYRAHDDQLKRDVAIKILNVKFSADAHAKINLLREAQSASALNDPHICTIYEIGEVNGHAFIVMEFIEGRTLKALIPSGGLPPALVAHYFFNGGARLTKDYAIVDTVWQRVYPSETGPTEQDRPAAKMNFADVAIFKLDFSKLGVF